MATESVAGKPISYRPGTVLNNLQRGLTTLAGSSIVCPQRDDRMAPMEDPEINTLIAKVDQLIEICDQLHQHNRQLLAQERSWREERLQLIEKNDLARQKVEAMILRLKSLEHDS